MVDLIHAGPPMATAFFASVVEAVEAMTVVLAAGVVHVTLGNARYDSDRLRLYPCTGQFHSQSFALALGYFYLPEQRFAGCGLKEKIT
jgi:hypothetical protein